jgi:hypothetical protein
MRPERSRPNRLRFLGFSALAPIAAAWYGCGSSGVTDAKLTDEARKSVFQKKVDVQNRPASSRTTRTPAKAR